MRHLLLAVLLLPLLLLTGCGGVDKARVEAEVAKLETRATELQAFIARTAPVVQQLSALAEATNDQTMRDAAAKVAATVAAAQAALPEVQTAIAATKTHLATLEADAAGKVPWWSTLAPLAVFLARFVPGVGPFVAEAAWALLASRRQKAADLNPTKA